MSDAVAAIIRTPQDKLLLQLRDDIPNIWYPATWGCFGGALDGDEQPLDALRRELDEELELAFTKATLVSRLEFDLRPSGLDHYFREYYLVEPTNEQLAKLVLHEGERMAEFSYQELAAIPLTPYDAFALHLYWAGKTGVLVKPGGSIGYNQAS
jgi:8-oxo-dGTP pyrophosphatase MutT (NUDIX family)